MKLFLLIPTILLAFFFPSFLSETNETPTAPATLANANPIELGQVTWLRNLEEAQQKAEQMDKPILLLFQEVPGCSTCRHYGTEVLSHPLVVEAIEDLFIPLAIHNNKKGYDAQVLKSFGEPAWNNPVVRIIDASKQDVVGRLSANYSLEALVSTMVVALQVSKKAVPTYLSLLREELEARSKGTQEANLAMYCFWSGEKNLGQLPGVIETQAGFMNGHEVVKVTYDPESIALTDLVRKGQQSHCADEVYVNDATQRKEAAAVLGADKIGKTGTFRLDKEPKYYLSHSIYRHVPLTQLQAARINSLLAQKQSPNHLLSPRQQELAQYIAAHSKIAWPNAINKSLTEAWKAAEAKRN